MVALRTTGRPAARDRHFYVAHPCGAANRGRSRLSGGRSFLATKRSARVRMRLALSHAPSAASATHIVAPITFQTDATAACRFGRALRPRTSPRRTT